ncbi:DUF402 domain-containing protein [Auraticoccus monumenti]|uniref:DUF402 domain-containing protein n=1 Tax=Auraticoccus monumenti TaxID=675864 RepID=UPI000B89F62D|nr:DUF402 domain-containing protein [Auraticoccus monumenti]
MSWPADARPGEPVLCRFTKWPGSEHWRHDCVWLGTDEHGDWIGQRAGARSWRPGAAFDNPVPNVSLVPAGAPDWVGTLFPPGHPSGTAVYLDLMWDVAWSPDERGVLTGIDMDLDVVRTDARGTFLDDEDEFAEHSARWDYPEDVRAQVVARADALLVDVRIGTAPFDGATGAGWLERLRRLE